MPEMSKSPATDREQLLASPPRLWKHWRVILFREWPLALLPKKPLLPPAHRYVVAAALSAALDWARLEGDLHTAALTAEKTPKPNQNIPYIPSNQVLALLQSAYDEYEEERAKQFAAQPFDTSDPGLAPVAWEKLKALIRRETPLHLAHQQLQLPARPPRERRRGPLLRLGNRRAHRPTRAGADPVCCSYARHSPGRCLSLGHAGRKSKTLPGRDRPSRPAGESLPLPVAQFQS